ncbi:DHA2 family efflux MFS transporter permease subunit [Liquorilactobacillus mali]|uniref:Major facilitator superfamily permease n=1 Tax=Liquorilactobacillus mali KCTC 3596 = DSM 20444 TaxID=1046596 RepID=J0L307_9LACO|nr:DHA2 family efflux MFS transporter permease subunit [Liquorilactobacillus mali]EJE97313.1 H+ antiporter-2 family protein [Liquorilactobacillus mali KCTC 3596 = DSM 20444]KRN11359.1 major facilitator superfamily permease [Liquorilactobacillus mali KCTC 3596 = DSM 20444]MDC7953136.1 DHA2 family efflux MFS transporter permease subunit [Liquorilactobacillus mali]MDV7757271.1 DHA2 family efflux MFS transporter permease subunit [Liquorilactobacillus mali]QFQ75307.1 multidrug efflux MFS transporte
MNKKKSTVSIALTLVLGALAPMLDTTMTNIAINQMIRSLSTTVNIMQWVTTLYVLAMGITVPIASWLIDRINGKTLYQFGIILFGIGSLVSALSNSIQLLIIGRLLQGIAAGLIVPTLTTLLVRVSGGNGLGKLMAIIGLPVVLAPILGPSIGGVLIHFLNWHWIFWINLPIVALSVILIWLLLPSFSDDLRKTKLDLKGFLLTSGIFTTFILAINELGNLPKENTIFWTLLEILIGLNLIIVYIIHAQKNGIKAIIPLSLFKNNNFSASTTLLFMSGLTVNGAMFLLPLYFQNIRGLSIISTGLYLIPQGVGLLLARTQVGKLTDLYGAKWPTIISIFISLFSTLPFVFFTKQTNISIIIVVLLIRGVAEGGLTIPVMTDAYKGVEKSLIAQATTGIRTIQNIGGAFGTAILSTIIQFQINGRFPTLGVLTPVYQVAFWATIIGTSLAFIPAIFLSHNSVKH